MIKQISKPINEAEGEDKKAKGSVSDTIKALIDTDWAVDNTAQMKAVQLLKFIATSDEAPANAFMKKINNFTSGLDAKDFAKGAKPDKEEPDKKDKEEK